MEGTRLRILALASMSIIAFLATTTGFAYTKHYTFEIPDNKSVTYRFEVSLDHPGLVNLEATWSGDRVFSFRIKSLETDATLARETGLSPQNFSFESEARLLNQPSRYEVILSAVGGTEAGSGRVSVHLPKAQVNPKPKTPKASVPTPAAIPEDYSWVIPKPRPVNIQTSNARLRETIEDLRSTFRDPKTGLPTADPCRWHQEMIDYLDRWHEFHLTIGTRPDSAHREYLDKVIHTIQLVSNLRNGRDRLLHGPIPEKRSKFLAWEAVRKRKIKEIEFALDEIRTLPAEGFAPELAGERWPPKFAACLTAVERYYDRRVLEGPEAEGSDLAELEWQSVVKTAAALKALRSLNSRP